ncbi:hypothetical protein [Nocardia mexicana]|uniref:hypothetical protein n=1 Tax=Nocardia mexicana TaxID=279262 RepID=UPI000832656A|nr:hypothetical protein [Nocardia mexicana]
MGKNDWWRDHWRELWEADYRVRTGGQSPRPPPWRRWEIVLYASLLMLAVVAIVAALWLS